MQHHNALAVNAAVEQLLGLPENWKEYAVVVVNFGAPLACASPFKMKGRVSGLDFRNPFSAFAPGMGNVKMDDEKKDPFEFEWGVKRERIGHYRIWKEDNRTIAFQHFWKSSIGTASPNETSTEYNIRYDPKTLEPHALFGVGEFVLFDFGGFKFTSPTKKLLLGKW